MNEQLSALIDDEMAIEDAEHLMVALQNNVSVGQAWMHYHFIGDAMRGSTALSKNFKQDLMQKIELEPTVLSPNAALKHQERASSQDVETNPAEINTVIKSRKIPAYWSIAASFSAVMVVGWMVLQTQTMHQDASMQVAQADNKQVLAVSVPTEIPEIPTEYLAAHQASAPTVSSYYIQAASYSE